MDSNVVPMPREKLTVSMNKIALDDVDPLQFIPKIDSAVNTELLGLFLQTKLGQNIVFDHVSPEKSIWLQ